MDVIKSRGESLHAFLASLLLHAGILLVLLTVSTESLRGDIFFVRLLSISDINEKNDSEGKVYAFSSATDRELFGRQSEIVITDKKRSQTLLYDERAYLHQLTADPAPENINKNFLKFDSQQASGENKELKSDKDDLDKTFSAGGPDRTIPSDAAPVAGPEEKTTLPLSSLRGDERELSEGEVLSELNSPEGPSFLELIRPVYPSLARRLGKEGSVLMRLYIDEQGRPVKVEIIKKAGFGFDEEAVRAIKQSRFRPAMKKGIPVSSVVILPVRFVLEE